MDLPFAVSATQLTLALLLILIGCGLCAAGWWLWRAGREESTIDINLLYSLSHDISNPLQGMLATLTNMAAHSESTTGADMSRWKQDIASLHVTVSHLAKLTADFKLLALLDSPDFLVQNRVIDLAGVAQKSIIAMDAAATSAGVRLTYQGPDRSPRIWGNESDLERVVVNLIQNGIKYSDTSKSQSEVVITLDLADGHLLLSVEDNGIGISETRLKRLWDKPFQPRSAQTIGIEGTGLGLYLVKRTVDKHNGTIQVESTAGQGTKFVLRFPVADSSDNA